MKKMLAALVLPLLVACQEKPPSAPAAPKETTDIGHKRLAPPAGSPATSDAGSAAADAHTPSNRPLPNNFELGGDPEISARKLLDLVYGSYDAGNGCWYTMKEEQRYCMKPDHHSFVSAASGKRLYVLATGFVVNEAGEQAGSHVQSGLVGAFVVEKSTGNAALIARTPDLYVGAFGNAPTKWKFAMLGADDYWGWQNAAFDAHGGMAGTRYVILAPYGNAIRDLAGFNGSYDDSNYCSDDDVACTKSRSKIDSMLAVDSSQASARIFPLLLTTAGTSTGKALPAKTWVFAFDPKTWSYVQPEGWPLDGLEF